MEDKQNTEEKKIQETPVSSDSSQHEVPPKNRSGSKLIKIFIFILVILFALGAFAKYKYSNTNNLQPPPQKKTITIAIISLKNNDSYESAIASMKEELIKKKYDNIQFLQEDITEVSQYTAAAKKYVDMNVDLIVTNSTPAVKAAMKATTTIPIVFGSVGDPVLNGVVPNMESSGRNVTGISSLSVELTRKRLDQLRLLVPNLTRLYIVHQPGEISSDNGRSLAVDEAKILNIKLIEKPATLSAEVKAVAAQLKSVEAQAILMAPSALVWASVDSLIEAQNREKIPLIGTDRTMAVKGAVITYGPSYIEIGRQVGDLVAQALSGTKPQYIPIQRPEKVELVINKKAADSIGLIIPDILLNKADSIMK